LIDLIYDPMETPWMAAAAGAGIENHNGISMLVHQAAVAFTLWTGVVAPVSAMRRAVENKFS
jgi:shikimate dehydrogenase